MYEDINQLMIKKIEQVSDKSEVMLSYSHDSITRDIKTLPQKKLAGPSTLSRIIQVQYANLLYT